MTPFDSDPDVIRELMLDWEWLSDEEQQWVTHCATQDPDLQQRLDTLLDMGAVMKQDVQFHAPEAMVDDIMAVIMNEAASADSVAVSTANLPQGSQASPITRTSSEKTWAFFAGMFIFCAVALAVLRQGVQATLIQVSGWRDSVLTNLWDPIASGAVAVFASVNQVLGTAHTTFDSINNTLMWGTAIGFMALALVLRQFPEQLFSREQSRD